MGLISQVAKIFYDVSKVISRKKYGNIERLGIREIDNSSSDDTTLLRVDGATSDEKQQCKFNVFDNYLLETQELCDGGGGELFSGGSD